MDKTTYCRTRCFSDSGIHCAHPVEFDFK